MQKYFHVGDYTEDLSQFFYEKLPSGVIIEKIEVLMDENGHDYLYVRYWFDNGSNQILERLIDDSFVKTIKYVIDRISKYYQAYQEIKSTKRLER